MDDFKVEDFKLDNECFSIWRLRRKFLLAHKDKFTTDRLICLANCFINVECHGCRYIPAVIEELKCLVEEMESRTDIEDIQPPPQIYRPPPHGTKREDAREQVQESPAKKKKRTCKDLPSDSNAEVVTDDNYRPAARSPKPAKVDPALTVSFVELSRVIKSLPNQAQNNNAIEVLYMSADKCRMKVHDKYSNLSQEYTCEIHVNDVRLATGCGASKKAAKHDACASAVELLKRSVAVHIERNNEFVLRENVSGENGDVVAATDDCVSDSSKGKSYSIKWQMSDEDVQAQEVLIIEPSSASHGINAKSILVQTGAFNKMNVRYDAHAVKDSNPTHALCRVYLGDQLLVTVECSGSQGECKTRAAECALRLLRRSCWTVRVKGAQELTTDSSVSRDDLMGQLAEEASVLALGDDNVGRKLMMKMGWTGGGIGSSGSGITEPVAVEGVINRQGLGLRAEDSCGGGSSKDFMNKVRQLLNSFATDDTRHDIKFSNEFTKEEREIIHREARKRHLKSNSHGKDELRFIVVSRRSSPNELFQFIMDNGGETSRFSLKPPDNQDNSASTHTDC